MAPGLTLDFGLPHLVAALLLGATTYYRVVVAKKPRLVYKQTTRNTSLVNSCPSLNTKYSPTPWAFNSHLQIALLMVKEALSPKQKYDRTDILTMADGGTTAIEWLGLNQSRDIPTVILLPTITGCGESLSAYSRYIQENLGWRIAVCVRRGHGGLPLTAPRLNTLGSTLDLREQISHIEALLPGSPLYAIGISAGSGLLVRYLGEQGEKTPIRAAFAYCPAYDTDVAFARAHPFYSSIMARKLIRYFLEPNRETFENLESFPACAASRNLDEFHQNFYGVAGYCSYGEYSAFSNPMKVVDGITVPLLVLNASDDPICSGRNVEENIDSIADLPDGLLVLTARGSHCAHFEGWRGTPWANKLMVEYLAANYAAQEQKPANDP